MIHDHDDPRFSDDALDDPQPVREGERGSREPSLRVLVRNVK